MPSSVTNAPEVPQQRSILAQLVRFVLVGGFCAVLDFGTYKGLIALGMDGVPLIDVARALSFIVGTTTAYLLNRRFTFDGAGGLRELSSFVLLYGTTFCVAVGVNRLMLVLLPDSGWENNLAWVVSQGTATTINFVMLRYIVFRETSHAAR